MSPKCRHVNATSTQRLPACLQEALRALLARRLRRLWRFFFNIADRMDYFQPKFPPPNRRELAQFFKIAMASSSADDEVPDHAPDFVNPERPKSPSQEAAARSQASHVYSIVLTGGPCAGKTTALERLSAYLRERGFRVFTVPEAATMLFSNGVSFTDLSSTEKVINFQAALMSTQIALEDTFMKLAENTGEVNAKLRLVCNEHAKRTACGCGVDSKKVALGHPRSGAGDSLTLATTTRRTARPARVVRNPWCFATAGRATARRTSTPRAGPGSSRGRAARATCRCARDAITPCSTS